MYDSSVGGFQPKSDCTALRTDSSSIAAMGLRIDIVSIAIAPGHVAAATVLVVATAVINEPNFGVDTLRNLVAHADVLLLNSITVYRHGVPGRVEPGALVNSRLAQRGVVYSVHVSPR